MKKFRSESPLARSLDLFGDKWTLLIIRDIGFEGKTTYKELVSMSEKIATNTLAERLNKLVEEGILTKTRSERHKLVFNYNLTEKGKSLLPVVKTISEWGAKNLFTPKEIAETEKSPLLSVI